MPEDEVGGIMWRKTVWECRGRGEGYDSWEGWTPSSELP